MIGMRGTPGGSSAEARGPKTRKEEQRMSQRSHPTKMAETAKLSNNREGP